MPEIIAKYGGLEDHVVDPFGFKYPLCTENGGFTSRGRYGSVQIDFSYNNWFIEFIV